MARLRLALTLALAHLGWNKAIVNVDEPDEAKRRKKGPPIDHVHQCSCLLTTPRCPSLADSVVRRRPATK